MAGSQGSGSSSGASRFFSSYYIANALLIVTYPLVRSWFLEHGELKNSRLQSPGELYIRERQALMVLLVGISVKFLRRQSLDAFASDAFTYAKGCIGLMAFYIDTRVLIYYTIMYVLVMVMFPQPLYAGPSRVEEFTPASFAELVEDRPDSNVAWLVNFFAPWAPQCLYLEPVIADLSLKYSTEKLRFGKVDVSRWPGMAKKYRINVRGDQGNQLPTLIMFERGLEAGRIPHVYEDGKVASGKFRRGDIVTAFALDERKEGKSGVEKKKAGSGGGGSGSKGSKKKN